MFHKYVSSATLRSYVAVNQEVANELERKNSPADIPVIVKEYTEDVYPEVVKNINDLRKIAVENIHPWITNLLIDWDKFDSIICTKVVEDDIKDISHSYKYQWTKHNVNKLIDYHTKYESQFSKPSVKKMTVWKLIAEEINKDDGNNCMVVSAIQCEQKWKNITKKFRDTQDHNRKSGNDKKVCPFYDELEACYGYRPNVCPHTLQVQSHAQGS